MQLGFVIDQSRCIGCHACTVACKSENDVPLGSFRTWVKYTETGQFPDVRRSFGVLRCNQCSAAPCVEICPVTALYKRDDGIVDLDRSVCIGCKSCMQACPYDALYINESSGVAEKCHFCAHRTEVGLAPACAVVCPTEAIIPGDFHDPESIVSRMRNDHDLTARKVGAGTGPNVFYREAHPSVLKPNTTSGAGGYLWSDRPDTAQNRAEVDEQHGNGMAEYLSQAQERASSRTVYDTRKPMLWGGKVSAYLFTKSISAGIFIAGAIAGVGAVGSSWTAGLALLFLLITTGLLIGDLKRPERFFLILTRPNWDSWVARGAIVLTAYGGLLSLWLFLRVLQVDPLGFGNGIFGVITCVGAAATAMYTAWLFGQAKGRPLWMKRGLAVHLLIQAVIAGFGTLFVLAPFVDFDAAHLPTARFFFQATLLAHLGMILLEGQLAPRKRKREYGRAARLLSHGRMFTWQHWGFGVGIGIFLAEILLAIPAAPWAWAAAGAAALIGLYCEEDCYVRAGQSIPIS